MHPTSSRTEPFHPHLPRMAKAESLSLGKSSASCGICSTRETHLGKTNRRSSTASCWWSVYFHIYFTLAFRGGAYWRLDPRSLLLLRKFSANSSKIIPNHVPLNCWKCQMFVKASKETWMWFDWQPTAAIFTFCRQNDPRKYLCWQICRCKMGKWIEAKAGRKLLSPLPLGMCGCSHI